MICNFMLGNWAPCLSTSSPMSLDKFHHDESNEIINNSLYLVKYVFLLRYLKGNRE